MNDTACVQSPSRFVAEVSRAIGSAELSDMQRTWALVSLIATSLRSGDADDDLSFFRTVVLREFLGISDLSNAASVACYQLYRDAGRLWDAIDGLEDAGPVEGAAIEFAVTARYWADQRDKP